MNRRSFLTGLIAAPVIIRSGILMPTRLLLPEPMVTIWDGVACAEYSASRLCRTTVGNMIAGIVTNNPDRGLKLGRLYLGDVVSFR